MVARFLALGLLFSGLSPGTGLSADTMAVVYPPDGALVTGSGSIAVLGYRPQGPAAFLTIAGKGQPQTVPVSAGTFRIAVNLEPGKNVLTAGQRTITVFVAADAASAAPGYSTPDAHAVDNDCEDCHSFAGGTSKLVEKPPALCLRCHDDVLKGSDGKPQAALHPPAEEGDCLACHPFHRLSIGGLPAGARRDLCFGCHDDFTGDGKKLMHTPVARGECTGCHGPHAAAGRKLLRASGVKLCLLCHADPANGKDGKAWAVSHPALDEGCPSCHEPHVSTAPRLLKKPVAQVCADCHDPFPSEQGGKQLLLHSPVEEGECASCHAVHGSDTPKLLAAPGKALCVTCHTDPSLAPDGAEWANAHPALDDGCFTCHLPHVAPSAGLLKSPQQQICAECHEPFPTAAAGGSAHLPAVQGKCSGCHAPHGSAFTKLLRASPGQGLCLRCHNNPALSPGGEAWAVPHPALDDGCPSCHLPHVAPAPDLLAKPQAALCASCHEDKTLDGRGEPWASAHSPVSRGLCASCHGPHGSRERALLAKPEFEICLSCHTDIHPRHRSAELDPSSGLPVDPRLVLPKGFPLRKKDGALSCLGCHRPHGSDNAMLTIGESPMFCSTCHIL